MTSLLVNPTVCRSVISDSRVRTAGSRPRQCGVDFLVVNMTAEVMAAGRRRRRNTLGVFRGSDRTRPSSATDRPASQAARYIAWSDRRCVSV